MRAAVGDDGSFVSGVRGSLGLKLEVIILILYYYTGQKFLRTILQEKQVKLSRYGRYGSLNDPFEQAAYDTSDRELRRVHKEQINKFALMIGLICLSETRHSPAMWAHYTDNHEGACLEIEVADDHVFKVKYQGEKLFPGLTLAGFKEKVNIDNIKEVLGTKSEDWSYEKEQRLHVPLTPDKVRKMGENYFLPFQEHEDNVFMLRRVFVGYRCGKGILNIREDVKDYPKKVEVIQTRPSFRRFEVIDQVCKRFWNMDECEKGNEHTLPAVKAVFG
ncbi:MAG: DUF2971 domain-containing protein [Loktanella sp.]|nr:DUF2971 domain-containing protein [Loktanella sp.]